MAHVENMPKLGKAQSQKRDGDDSAAIEFKPEPTKGQGAESGRGQCQAMQHDQRPLRAAEQGLLRIARCPIEDVAIAFAHGKSKGGEYVGDQIEIEDLQG